MELEYTILSELTKAQRGKHCMLFLLDLVRRDEFRHLEMTKGP